MSRTLRLVVLATGGAAFAIACLGPTQVTLRVTTDVDCETVRRNGTTIREGALAGAGDVTSTKGCEARQPQNLVGTLVLVPSGSKDEKLSLVVVLGKDVPTEECAANDYRGCIIAKRRLGFVSHESLDLPVELSLSCLSVVCNPDDTCFRGKCISAEVSPEDGCLGPECKGPGEPQPGGSPDAASEDATLVEGGPPPSDAAVDGGPTDAPIVGDPSLKIALLIPSTPNGVPRGVALQQTEVWWTERIELTNESFVGKAPASSGAPRSKVLSVDGGDLYGLAFRNDQFLYAVESVSYCGHERRLDGSFVQDFGCSAGNFVGVAPLDPTFAFFTSASGNVRHMVSPSAAGGNDSTYAERQNSTISYPTGSRIRMVHPADGGELALVGVDAGGGVNFRGIAVDLQFWIVSTTFGELWTVDRGSGAQSRFDTALSGVEDLAYEGTSDTLYVAAAAGPAGPGIYTITGIATARAK